MTQPLSMFRTMKVSTTRVETFSDGVIAIIITIMVLELMPDFKTSVDHEDVLKYLREVSPKLVTYVFSFIMLGIFWINHHHMFHLLEGSDEIFLFQNLLFLFWLSLIPVATAILGANPFIPDSVALFGFVMFVTTLSFTWMRIRITRRELHHKDQDKALAVQLKKVSIRSKTKSIIGTCAYFVSIPLAFVHVYVAFGCFMISPIIFFIPDGIR